MQTYVIDFQQILQGQSGAERVSQTGINIKSKGLNLEYNKGVIHFTKNPQTRDATITEKVVATCGDQDIYARDRYLVNAQGKFYIDNGGVITLKQQDVTNTYQPYTSDMVIFLGNIYATSQTNVALLNGDMTSLNSTWWTTTRSHPGLNNSYRHPLLVVEDTLYIADKNNIHTWDGTTSVPNTIVLPPQVNITAMVRHQDGRRFIAYAEYTANASGGLINVAKRYLIEPFDATWAESDLDDQVNGAITVGGVNYVATVNKLGVDTGQGIRYIRELKTQKDAWRLVTKHKMFNDRGTLLIAEGKNVLALGEILPGQPAFWYLHRQDVIYDIDTIYVVGNSVEDKLCITSQDNLNGTGNPWSVLRVQKNDIGYNGILYLDRIPLPSKAIIRRIDIERTRATSNSTSYRLALSRDNDDSESNMQIQPVQGSSRDKIMTNIISSQPQLIIYPDYGQSYGYQKIILYYELTDL